MGVLDAVRTADDLKQLDVALLPELAAEIRQFLVDHVSGTGGHLGPNLGIVELTLALHRTFDVARDRLLWDTGHQTYVHKLLTGRRDAFPSLRRRAGLSAYPSRAESPADVIENSHASTALSYADGLAKARTLRGPADQSIVAVVGDGSLTGGMAWEALNNLGAAAHRAPVIVVLNDNGRSYAPTVGGLADHLARLRAAGPATPSGLFRELGFHYLGPLDGHDTAAVEAGLRAARDSGRSTVVHCVTEKGRGYAPATQCEADRFHAVPVIDPATGLPRHPGGRTWTSLFAAQLAEAAETRDEVVALTAAMSGPTGLDRFGARFPERVFDVGIAEQHAVGAAAGLAAAGLHPVLAIYSVFVNRAFDQVLADLALHRAPATLVLDRAGITGEDGASHHGMWDLSVLQVVPGIRVAAPRDEVRLGKQLREALDWTAGPTVVRFPKGPVEPERPALRCVDGVDIVYEGERPDVLIACVGPMVGVGVQAAEFLAAHGVGATVVDPGWVLPVRPALVRLADQHWRTISIEDNVRVGGFGCALAQALRDAGVDVPFQEFALPAEFLPQGSRRELLNEYGMTGDRIGRCVLAAVGPGAPLQKVGVGRWPR
jgi:1-deoxy-D-xylulose-5-phosphate synthase